MIKVVVKGNGDNAMRHAGFRNIRTAVLGDQLSHWSVLAVDDWELKKVTEWYCEEPADTPAGAGFPIGTCMFYSQHREPELGLGDDIVREAE